MEKEMRLTYKRSLDGFEDVGLREGVTVGEAICKLADLEEKETVEVVHGRIEDVEIVPNYMWKYRCSCCQSDAERWYKYCPNCGAKMDGERRTDGNL